MEFYERVSGSRMHAAFIRPGGVAQDLPKGLLEDIFVFVEQFYGRIDEIKDLLTNNRIWRQRLINVGLVSKEHAALWAFSGVMLRGSGFCWDLRVVDGYDNYNLFDFAIPVGHYGDCFDRYLIRLDEMRESLHIISQCLLFLKFHEFYNLGSFVVDDDKIVPPSRS